MTEKRPADEEPIETERVEEDLVKGRAAGGPRRRGWVRRAPGWRRRLSTVAKSMCLVLLLAGPGVAQTTKIGEIELPADCALLRNERPRLLFRGRDLPRYRERITGVMKSDFERFKAYWDAKIAEKDYDWKNEWALDGVCLGVLYQLTGEKRYADAVRKTTAFRKGGVRGWAPAFALDLVWDTLSKGEIDAQVELLLAGGNKYRGFSASCRLWPAVALYGGGSGRDDEIAKELTTGVHAARVKLAEADAWADDRGGDSTSFSYLPSHTVNLVCPHVFAFTNALGTDVWKTSTWMRHLGSYYVYHFYPWEPAAIHFDYTCGRHMGPVGEQDAGARYMLPAAPARYRDGLYQWWTHRLYVHEDPALEGWAKIVRHARVMGGLWCRILFHDPEVPMLGPENFPPSRFFPTRGLACMRESWDTDATFVHFACGAWAKGRDDGRRNADNNQFTVYRKGILALDTGGQHGMDAATFKFNPPGNHHTRHYASETIAHNAILVRHPDDDAFWKAYGKCNTGGQVFDKWPAAWTEKRGMPVPAPSEYSWAGPPRPTGRTLAWETSPEYDYVCGDAANSYSPTTVDAFTRQLVYVRPDLIFVYDRVETARDGCRTTWLLHAADRPVTDGRETPDVRVHPEGHFLWEGSTATVTDEERGGRMFCRVLEPMKREVRLVGGENHEFELPDGTNPGPTPETYRLSDAALRAGRAVGLGLRGWRIEIEDRTGGRSVRFLNVFQTCDRDTPEMAPCERVERSGMVGAKVKTAGGTVEVLFRPGGDPGGHVTIEHAGRRVVDRALATAIEDHYERWKATGDYAKWMTDPYRRSVVLGRNPEDAGGK